MDLLENANKNFSNFLRRPSTLAETGRNGNGVVGGGAVLAAASTSIGEAAAFAGRNPEDIPKEDLLHLCMKLSKRLKVVEARSSQLATVHKEVLLERQELLSLAREAAGEDFQSAEGEGKLDLAALREAWQKQDNSKNQLIQELQRGYQDAVRAKDNELHKAESIHRREIMELQARLQVFERQLADSSREPPSPAAAPPGKDAPPQPSPRAAESVPPAVLPSPAAKGKKHAPTLSMTSSADIMQGELEKLERELSVLRADKDRLGRELDLERQNLGLAMKSNQTLRQQLNQAKEESSTSASRVKELGEQAKRNTAQHEERVLFMQLQMQKAQKAAEASAQEAETHKAEAAAGRAEVAKSRETEAKLQEALRQQALLTEALREVQERAELAQQWRSDINVMGQELLDAKKDAAESRSKCEGLVKRLAEAENKAQALSTAKTELEAAHKENSRIKQALTEKDALVTRLRAESQTADKVHATRTAMMGTLEHELGDVKEELARETKRAGQLQQQAEAAEIKRREAQQAMQAAQKALEGQERRSAEAEEALRKQEVDWHKRVEEAAEKWRREEEDRLNELRVETNKKSAMARKLVDDKDKQVVSLKARVDALEQDIASGGHSERRIMELAQAQAMRGAGMAQELEKRDQQIRSLTAAMTDKAAEISALQARMAELRRRAEAVRRQEKRDGVNMEYLKNIIVQYMTFGSGTSERRALVPVISTLLQFSEEDIQRVEQGLVWEWWGGFMNVKDTKRR